MGDEGPFVFGGAPAGSAATVADEAEAFATRFVPGSGPALFDFDVADEEAH